MKLVLMSVSDLASAADRAAATSPRRSCAGRRADGSRAERGSRGGRPLPGSSRSSARRDASAPSRRGLGCALDGRERHLGARRRHQSLVEGRSPRRDGLGGAEPDQESLQGRLHTLQGGAEALIGGNLPGLHVREAGAQEADLPGLGRAEAGRLEGLSDRVAGGPLHHSLARCRFPERRHLPQQVAHGALQPGQRRIGAVRRVEATGQGDHLPLQGVEALLLGAGADLIDLLGEAAQHGVDGGHVARAGDTRLAGALGPVVPRAEHVDLLGERLDLLRQCRRRGDLHVAADLLQERTQIRSGGRPLQLGDLRAHRLQALREALDSLRTGERADLAADLLEFGEQARERVVIRAGGAGRGRGVEALGEAPDILRDAAVNVLGHLLGEALDLSPDLLDRHRDGGEIGPRLGALDAARESDDGLLEGADIPARRQLVDRLPQARGLLLELEQRGRRGDALLDPRLQPAGEVQTHAGDNATIGRSGGRRRLGALRQFALPLADVLDGAADVGGGGARATAGLAGRGDLLAELGHAALDVAEPLGHLLDGRRLQGALDARLDLREAPRLGLLGGAPLVVEGAVEAVEAVHQSGDAVAVAVGALRRAVRPVIGRGRRRGSLDRRLGPAPAEGELLGAVTPPVPAIALAGRLLLRHHRRDPGLERHARPRRHVAGRVEHLGIETVELRHRVAGHRWPVVGSVRRPFPRRRAGPEFGIHGRTRRIVRA